MSNSHRSLERPSTQSGGGRLLRNRPTERSAGAVLTGDARDCVGRASKQGRAKGWRQVEARKPTGSKTENASVRQNHGGCGDSGRRGSANVRLGRRAVAMIYDMENSPLLKRTIRDGVNTATATNFQVNEGVRAS